jgi:hypothetical protein
MTMPQPVTRPLAEVQAACTKASGDAVLCGRVAEQAHLRYGDKVTARQWRSASCGQKWRKGSIEGSEGQGTRSPGRGGFRPISAAG